MTYSIIRSTAWTSNENECIFNMNGSRSLSIFLQQSPKEYHSVFVKAPEKYKMLKDHIFLHLWLIPFYFSFYYKRSQSKMFSKEEKRQSFNLFSMKLKVAKNL